MRALHAIEVLTAWSRRSRTVFTRGDLRKLFPDDSDLAFKEGLKRLVEANILTRVSRGVFVYANAERRSPDLIEEIAVTLRRGHYCYLSLESALSEYGVISQIPLAGISVMTTGRSGLFKTPYGNIEFTHSERGALEILRGSSDVGRPLRLASVRTAIRDLRRVGRNLHLVDDDALEEAFEDGLQALVH